MSSKEVSEKLQSIIDLCLEQNIGIPTKQCSKCGRRLPAHEWFFTKQSACLHGVASACKECLSKTESYNFIDIFFPWYETLDKLYCNFRKMSIGQIEKFYNKDDSTIKAILKKNKYNINRKEIIKSLTEEEIIFMYESLLKNEIKSFTNGIFLNNNKNYYVRCIINYLINEKLHWNREDICNNYSGKILKDYKLTSIQGCTKLTTYEFINITFPQYDIKPWEIKSSSCGNGYWKNEHNVALALNWLKNKILIEKNIYNIHQAGTIGFDNIINEYGLIGLRVSKFNSTIDMFEAMYDCKFNKEEMLKINYTFKVKTNIVNKQYENKIYSITDKYKELDDLGKTLINEIIRFCEIERRFPQEKDMTNKNGYISRVQYYKYFESNNFEKVYEYIIPIISNKGNRGLLKLAKTIIVKPKSMKCVVCGEEKPFTNKYFSSGAMNKFGLKYECLDCVNIKSKRQMYNKKGISFNKITDIAPEQWWEYYNDGKISLMPKFCYIEKNEIKVIRHIFIDILKCNSKELILENFNRNILEKYKIDMIVYKIGGKITAITKSFPEYNFEEKDFDKYNDENICDIIDSYLRYYNYTIMDILNNRYEIRNVENNESRDLYNVLSARFNKNNNDYNGVIGLFMWYFNYKDIKHPILNRNIIREDFRVQSCNYYKSKENRINRIKHYCENQCEENILDVINDNKNLKKWIFKYFKQEHMVAYNLPYTPYYKSLYDVLVEAYPCILDNKSLFKWEWHQWNKYNKELIKQMLKELVLYRLNNIIIDLEKDIPKYLNTSFMNTIYPKFNKHIDKKKISNYYEWACESFPEFKDKWTKQDFGHIISKDGNEFDSYQEKDVYEFIQSNDKFKYIKSIGKKRKNGKFIFELGDGYDYTRFCPDFVIEYIEIKGKKKKLVKPIIIEFYGMYCDKNENPIYKYYREKTKVKEQFYKSREDIYYIGIYPNDIKNGYKELTEKLALFCLNLKYIEIV